MLLLSHDLPMLHRFTAIHKLSPVASWDKISIECALQNLTGKSR